MVTSIRILISLVLWLGVINFSHAAAVPTQRVIAPRSLDSVPNINIPGNSLELQNLPPAPDEDTIPGSNDEPPKKNLDHKDLSEPLETSDAEEDVLEIPEIHYSDEKLPAAVKQMRKDILEAALTANYDRLRLVYDANQSPPTLSFGDIEDPITFLKKSSGDPDGLEILAILIEVLQAGWVHINPGEPDEMYVWPYFAEMPLHMLSNKQKVELFKIVTASDVEEMETFGSYIFYRLGIGADGSWYFFVAGD